jgi:hypothetical protein
MEPVCRSKNRCYWSLSLLTIDKKLYFNRRQAGSHARTYTYSYCGNLCHARFIRLKLV